MLFPQQLALLRRKYLILNPKEQQVEDLYSNNYFGDPDEYRTLSSEEVPTTYNIAFLGSNNSGKSSLIDSVMNRPFTTHYNRTNAVKFINIYNMNSTPFFKICDKPGDNVFDTSLQSFLKQTDHE